MLGEGRHKAGNGGNLETMSRLDEEKTIWITRKHCGTVRTLSLKGRRIRYRVPEQIEQTVTLRFRGCGKTIGSEIGNLLLHVRVDSGQNIELDLWLSEAETFKGCTKTLLYRRGFFHSKERVEVVVPPRSADSGVVRLPGRGSKSSYHWGLPLLKRPIGDMVVRLRVYPDYVDARYRSVESLSDEVLALEAWVYRRSDEVLQALKNRPHSLPLFTAGDVADLFNQGGWRTIARALVARLRLNAARITFHESASLPVPGQCQKQVYTKGSVPTGEPMYTIKIHTEFLADPFAVTAILAHELCHIVEAKWVSENETAPLPEGKALMEMERTVDLLVFLYQLGEFQMRVARQSRLTLGYFNQETFERMYVIHARKRNTYHEAGNRVSQSAN